MVIESGRVFIKEGSNVPSGAMLLARVNGMEVSGPVPIRPSGAYSNVVIGPEHSGLAGGQLSFYVNGFLAEHAETHYLPGESVRRLNLTVSLDPTPTPVPPAFVPTPIPPEPEGGGLPIRNIVFGLLGLAALITIGIAVYLKLPIIPRKSNLPRPWG